jgi:hypothetical protein
MNNTSKVLSKHVASVNKCFDKCFKNASKSLLPASDCQPNPVLPNDAATQTCINTASGKTTIAADKLCTTAGVAIGTMCPQFCTANADCDTGPPDGVCTNNNCSAGNTSTHAYSRARSGRRSSATRSRATSRHDCDSPMPRSSTD